MSGHKHYKEFHNASLEELGVTAVIKQRGRPKAPSPKVQQTLRIDADVLAAFKATGKGWQTRINQALREELGI